MFSKNTFTTFVIKITLVGKLKFQELDEIKKYFYNFSMRPLNWLSPIEKLQEYQSE